MVDPDELLARADEWHENPGKLMQLYPNQILEVIDGLAAALRAALAAQPQPDELERLRKFVAAHDAVEGLVADFIDDRDAYNQAVTRLRDARAAVAGSVTPTEARCRSMEDGTPLTCEFQAGHEGPHSFDQQPLCGTCGQPLVNEKCFRYHVAAAGSATPTEGNWFDQWEPCPECGHYSFDHAACAVQPGGPPVVCTCVHEAHFTGAVAGSATSTEEDHDE